jgi:hypothetical protein
VPSVLPSSTTMISWNGALWSSSDVSAARTYSSSF